MSHNSKNLSYEMKEPAFLRRMRQQQSGSAQERYIAPRNKKTAVDDDEDAPVYVMEGDENEVISRKEFEELAGGKAAQEEEEKEKEKGEDAEGVGGSGGGEPQQENTMGAEPSMKVKVEDHAKVRKDNVTEVGAKGKKRKVARIVGSDDKEEQEKKDEPLEKKGKRQTGAKTKRVVKLSFGDDE